MVRPAEQDTAIEKIVRYSVPKRRARTTWWGHTAGTGVSQEAEGRREVWARAFAVVSSGKEQVGQGEQA